MDVIRCDEQEYLVHKWRPSGEANSTKKERSVLIAFMAPISTTRVGEYTPKEWNDFQVSHSMATG